ncbi:MAG: inositol monophosphatase family protein [Acidimicrobiia bacterium]
MDAADAETRRRWSEHGHPARTKRDGTPVTEADIAAEQAMFDALRQTLPEDGFLGEEIGEHPGRNGRRWIADGIDGTRFFAAGEETWGTLLALEAEGAVVLGVSSSPMQDRRWWATRGGGAFVGRTDGSGATRLRVSTGGRVGMRRVLCLPGVDALTAEQRSRIERAAGGRPADRPWSHQLRVASGEVDVCVWYAGDIWDHAAPSIIVEEAGGRFSDHDGGRRLDTRTAVYSNGVDHDHVLRCLSGAHDDS